MSEQDRTGGRPGTTSGGRGVGGREAGSDAKRQAALQGGRDAGSDAKRQAALQGALTQIERQFGKGTVMRMGDPGSRGGRCDLDGCAVAGRCARDRRCPSGADHRDLRPGILGKTTLVYHIIGRGAEARRGVRVRRCRARHGSDLRAADRHRHRRVAGLPTRLRRAGARGRRHADPLWCGRRDRGRLGRSADAEG